MPLAEKGARGKGRQPLSPPQRWRTPEREAIRIHEYHGLNMPSESSEPKLEILGVYRLDVTPEVFAAQLPMYGDEAQCRYHFSSVVLIEALARNCSGSFSLDDMKQPRPWRPNEAIHPHPFGLDGIPPGGSFQAPWDEGLLSPDGERVLARSIGCVKGQGTLRFAFYIHYWDEEFPLQWTYGEVPCPAPQEVPERLKRLMPYRPCD